MSSWKLAAAWVVALVVTTALTWQIVSVADNQVSARPVEVTPSTTDTTEPPATTTTAGSDGSTTTVSPTTTVPGSGSSSSSSSSSPSTSSSSSSTSSTSADPWSVRTITTSGGVVVVRYRPGEVELQAATPLPGYEMEIDDTGPTRVRVEFENDDIDIRVDVEWRDGLLDVEVTGDD